MLQSLHLYFLDFTAKQVLDHLSSGDPDGVVDGLHVQSGEDHIGEAERQHKRDPA